ncbi:MAG: excinuclease ABC subunit UvrA [Deltaproteobacteria bacterium]|nr:excinuclease ABC subunit UvrA [Deltaproteobacteria bacterium]
MADKIIIKGAREHNLKDIDVEIPRDKLVVITGLSGSGKSSLAFDTIYAEGQRRYVESLSAYARQFLEQMEKPDVDSIEGLSPAISIEQKTTSKNPRSTVGTVTEIYDYLRLLFARVGKPFCYQCGKEISSQPISQMVDQLLALPEGSRVNLYAPVVRSRKGEYKKELYQFRKDGFLRARIDKKVTDLSEDITLDKNKKHDIDVMVDRVVIKEGVAGRVAEAFETALKLADGIARAEVVGDREILFSDKFACIECGISYPEITPRLFSFNNPNGACPACDYKPFRQLPKKHQDVILYGSGEEEIKFYIEEEGRKFSYKKPFEGVIPELQRRYLETDSEYVRGEIERFMGSSPCPTCHGKRLRRESLFIRVEGKDISDVVSLSVSGALDFFKALKLCERDRIIAERIIKEIRERLGFLIHVGLDYLTLDRAAGTLSGGEGQRIRLATQIGSSLVGVLYILDEPSIGLHQRDNKRLLDSLMRLRDIGNTVLVVEHDEETILEADYVLDMGPGAGVNGGRIVAQGTPLEIMNNDDSLTGRFLSRKEMIHLPEKRRAPKKKAIRILGAKGNNLKSVDVSIPIGLFTCVTGVSGSGKSTLVVDTLYRALSQRFYGSRERAGEYERIEGLEYIDKVIDIDQAPIGRTPRSNPATYSGLFTHIRDLFAALPESRVRGYKAGRYSFNVKGGRCEACAGDGIVKIEMHFLPDIYVTCEVCRGKRYNRETMEVRYKGKNIAEILDMTVDQALPMLENIPPIKTKLKTLQEVGLGYIKLGQSATTLSGGEAQRVKLAKELSKRGTGKTLYILDEPTTGLHFADIKKLLEVLHALCDAGNTILVIEHNLDVIKTSDHIIDLGPEGGANGGMIVASGTPEKVAVTKGSYTGEYLKKVLY